MAQKMNKYISTDRLRAEIEKKIIEREKELKSFSDEDYVCSVASDVACRKRGYLDIIELLDSLQQEEEQEVDLDKEITCFFSKNTIPYEHLTDWPLLKNTALYFYELGQRKAKEESK